MLFSVFDRYRHQPESAHNCSLLLHIINCYKERLCFVFIWTVFEFKCLTPEDSGTTYEWLSVRWKNKSLATSLIEQTPCGAGLSNGGWPCVIVADFDEFLQHEAGQIYVAALLIMSFCRFMRCERGVCFILWDSVFPFLFFFLIFSFSHHPSLPSLPSPWSMV